VVRTRQKPVGAAGLPERLREARERMHLSQSKLSLLAGLGRITVHNIEERRTQGNVGIITVEKLAKVLRVPPCWLAYGSSVVSENNGLMKSVAVSDLPPLDT
jgi:transcriptional regulator with XRE-family HTH domain